MKKLNTIQKYENLNDIYATDEIGPGGSHHRFAIVKHSDAKLDNLDIVEQRSVQTIQFQCGPRNDENSTHGVTTVDLLEIVRNTLTSFQEGPYASKENQHAVNHIEEALLWLNKRTEDRIERNVLGTYKE